MRTLENQLDGLHLEREDERRQDLATEDRREDEVPEVFGEAAVDRDLPHRTMLIEAMTAIFERRQLLVSGLRLPQREQSALECLQSAVSGRDVSFGQFVFASDRADLLETALAMLQPNLISQDQTLLATGGLRELTARVAELRHSLTNLEDAQDELIAEGDAPLQKTASDEPEPESESESESEPEPEPEPEPDVDAPAPASTLDGPELAEPPKPASTLS